MGGRVDVKGLESVISNMKAFSQKQKERLDEAGKLAVGILYEDVMQKVQIVDEHDLNALSHYFAYDAGNGKVKYIGAYSTKMGADSGPHADEFTHIQGGQLYSSVEQVCEREGDKLIIAVGVREDKVPYIKYLIEGTSKMRPRDFLGHSWIEKKDVVLDIIKNALTVGDSNSARGGVVK